MRAAFSAIPLIALVACANDMPVDAVGSSSQAIQQGYPRVAAGGATSVGTTAFTANGRIKTDGSPTTYHVEYGPTKSYGSQTTEKPLPPRLAAHYREGWGEGLNGWHGGVPATHLAHQGSGGAPGPFARYTDQQGSGDDTNHYDGIGLIHLAQWIYTGTAVGFPSLFLGGGDLDLRDARVEVDVRGTSWQGMGSELVFWTQSDHCLPKQDTAEGRRANWAHTGFSLSDSLDSGTWQHASYRLENDSREWTYSGRYGTRPIYEYMALDDSLAHVNTDVFHNLVFVRLDAEPSGSIDFDEFDLDYRNHSLLLPSNGGTLVSSPAGSDPTRLTDGWRNGKNRSWESNLDPVGPLEFVYDFDDPVSISTVQIHQNTAWPSREIEVLVSDDGVSWSSLKQPLESTWTLPESSPLGPNYAFFLERKVDDQREPQPLHTGTVRHAKIRILSGYKRRWGLGEIELFGTGAKMGTDTSWYNVSQDVTGLTPGQTYHYRFVASSGSSQDAGPDRTFTVPMGDHPLAVTRDAIRVHNASATLRGELNPLGVPVQYYFEYGLTSAYDRASPGPGGYAAWGGLMELPRPVSTQVTGLVPGVTYHYRLVVHTVGGDDTYGADETFVAQ